MKVASFRSAPPHYILPQVKGIEEIYRSPAPEFLLSRMTVNGSCRISEQNSAQIFLLIEGEISITPSKGEKLTLRKGESAFITATADACRISGKGSAVRAMVNGNKKN
jgi:mannose-6-phosphate isomerase